MKKWSKKWSKMVKSGSKGRKWLFLRVFGRTGLFWGGGAWGVPRVSLKVLQKDVLVSSKSIKSALKGKKMVKKC